MALHSSKPGEDFSASVSFCEFHELRKKKKILNVTKKCNDSRKTIESVRLCTKRFPTLRMHQYLSAKCQKALVQLRKLV